MSNSLNNPQTKLRNDPRMSHNLTVTLVKLLRIRGQIPHIKLRRCNPPIKVVLESRLHRRDIDRVLHNERIRRISVQVHGSDERLGDGQAHNDVKAGDDPTAGSITIPARPLFGARLVERRLDLFGKNVNGSAYICR